MQLTMGSLFDGIGGFPLAAERHGITPVWASEIEAMPISITKRHFPNMQHLGDITQINGAEIEPVDVITLGSPCQDISIAGRRAGLNGEKSSLFMEAIRIIREMRGATNNEYPRFIIWENVPGAFSSNKGLDFRTVLEEIAESTIPMPSNGKWATAGMVELPECQIAWRVLDAQYWGTPQRRRRIFLVADFRGKCAGEILFEREGLYWNITEGEQAKEGDATSVKESVRKDCPTIMAMNQNASGEVRSGTVANTLSTNSNASGRNAPLVIHPQVAGTICASGAGLNRPAGMGSELDLCIAFDDYVVRRLTPTECERLQGFPTGWTECGHDGKPVSDTQRYKALGNSIAIPCVEYIMQGISDCRRRVSIS